MNVLAMAALCSIAAVAFVGLATFRRVPDGHHAIVTRAGMPVRSKRGGLLAAMPGLERVHVVSTHPSTIDPLAAYAITRDGVEVQLVVSVLFRITNPAMAVALAIDPRATTADVVERAVHHLVAQTDLINLLQGREEMLAGLVAQQPPRLDRVGVELVDIDLLDVEVRVGAQLLHLLVAPSASRPRSG